MIIDARDVNNVILNCNEMTKIRASYYFMGALLSLYKDVSVLGPGGCKFASRPIDLHLFCFKELGCDYYVDKNSYTFKRARVKNRKIEFSKVSVGATINAILASCRLRGNIRLVNVAKEPEIDDLITFLNKCGANIKREDNEIIIRGRSKFHGCEHEIIQDRIEAGTFLIIGACLGNELKIEYRQSKYLKSLIELLIDLGVNIKINKNHLIVSNVDVIKDVNIICDTYPSIPTDLQQPLSILLSRCNKHCLIKDNIYPSRYTQIDDLNKMGFDMKIENGTLIVNRAIDINGNVVECKDLRGGASLVIAGLIAKGETKILNIEHIERGYFNILDKLKKIGAKVYEEN